MSSLRSLYVAKRMYDIDNKLIMPEIKNEHLVLYLNPSIRRSYTSNREGKIWRDISGRNNHFIFKCQPRYTAGKLLTLSEGCEKGMNEAYGPIISSTYER